MIKINLLGVAPPPTAAMPRPPATLAFQVATFVGALVVCFAVVGLFYKVWSGAVVDLEKQKKDQEREQARLAAIKAENERYQKQIKQLEQRSNTIDMLQASRVGPVELMTTLGAVVNRRTDIYLVSVAPAAGDRVAIRGQTSSVESMADFMSALDHSGSFADVQLRQFFEDDEQGRVNYKFNLDCAYKLPMAAATPAEQPAAPATTPPPPRRAL
jgi:Tfp pilus assembly protein PilN